MLRGGIALITLLKICDQHVVSEGNLNVAKGMCFDHSACSSYTMIIFLFLQDFQLVVIPQSKLDSLAHQGTSKIPLVTDQSKVNSHLKGAHCEQHDVTWPFIVSYCQLLYNSIDRGTVSCDCSISLHCMGQETILGWFNKKVSSYKQYGFVSLYGQHAHIFPQYRVTHLQMFNTKLTAACLYICDSECCKIIINELVAAII